MFKLIMGILLGILVIIAMIKGGITQGSVSFLIQDWDVQMPLWLALCLLLGVTFIFWFFFKLIGWLFGIGERWRSWRLARQRQKAYRETEQGYLALAEERWAEAEKLFIQAVAHVDTPISHYLSAAKAAQELGAEDRRDIYLQKGRQLGAKTDLIAIDLAQAEYHVQNGEYKKGLAELLQLHDSSPKHPVVLRLLKNVYVQLNDWVALRALLPELYKKKVLNALQHEALERQVLEELLWAAEHTEGIEACRNLWQTFSKTIQVTPSIVLVYANILIRHHGAAEAESVLRASLKKEWHDGTIALYGKISGADIAKQLAFAETWLAQYESSANLLLTCGRLSLTNQLWGKAQRYFEASLAIEKRAETYAELGRLLEYLNKPELSHEQFRQGLLLEIKK